jgi:hypothetical protein
MTNPKSKISKNVPNTIKLRNLVVFFYYKERGGNVIISMKMRYLLTRIRWLEDYSSNQKKYRKAIGISLPLVIGAVVSGGLFGDNCSPISDTTIQSSTSACCDHIQHVKTQLPYASIVGGASGIGYLIAGYFSEFLALPITMLIIIGILFILKRRLK